MSLYLVQPRRTPGVHTTPHLNFGPTNQFISMSDATYSTILVSHHRYFIAHSLVSLIFLSTSSGLHQIHLTHTFMLDQKRVPVSNKGHLYTHMCYCVFNGSLYETMGQVPGGLSTSQCHCVFIFRCEFGSVADYQHLSIIFSIC